MKRNTNLLNVVAAFVGGLVLATAAASSGLPQAGAVWREFDQHANETGLQTAFGNFTDLRLLHKFGRNSNVGNAAEEDVWGGGGIYVWPTAAETLSITSADPDDTALGDGAQTIKVMGLDANYLEVEETIALNGLGAVVTIQTFLRVNRSYVVTAGASETNEGIITAVNSSSANILIMMPALVGQTNLGLFTVPANTALLITQIHGSIGTGAPASQGLIMFRIRLFGGAWRTIDYDAVASDGKTSTNQPLHPPIPLAAKTDIIMRAGVTKNSSDINAGFGGYLVTQ